MRGPEAAPTVDKQRIRRPTPHPGGPYEAIGALLHPVLRGHGLVAPVRSCQPSRSRSFRHRHHLSRASVHEVRAVLAARRPCGSLSASRDPHAPHPLGPSGPGCVPSLVSAPPYRRRGTNLHPFHDHCRFQPNPPLAGSGAAGLLYHPPDRQPALPLCDRRGVAHVHFTPDDATNLVSSIDPRLHPPWRTGSCSGGL